VAFFAVSSGLLTAQCADWCKTRWGVGAFDRLRSEGSLCGVGIYNAIWWESGGYTHLHRDVPLIQINGAAQLAQDAAEVNALIAPQETSGIPSGFKQAQCWKGVCLLERPGPCAAPKPEEELNTYLKSMGQ
jgi:GPI mannosyltransferase 3